MQKFMTSTDPARIRPNPASDPITSILAGFSLAAKAWKVPIFREIVIDFRLPQAIRPESGQIRPRDFRIGEKRFDCVNSTATQQASV
jgi:hypothetical protein